VLALDVGTTGVKAACVARSGRLVATAEAAYARPTHAPAPGHAEQAPADWLAAAGDAATRCVAALPPVRREPTARRREAHTPASLTAALCSPRRAPAWLPWRCAGRCRR